MGSNPRIVNIFRSLFFTFFSFDLDDAWTFTLDNLDESQEKSHEKIRKIF
jgi:hypothetical protein